MGKSGRERGNRQEWRAHELKIKQNMMPPFYCPKCNGLTLYIRKKNKRITFKNSRRFVINKYAINCISCGLQDVMELAEPWEIIDVYCRFHDDNKIQKVVAS